MSTHNICFSGAKLSLNYHQIPTLVCSTDIMAASILIFCCLAIYLMITVYFANTCLSRRFYQFAIET